MRTRSIACGVRACPILATLGLVAGVASAQTPTPQGAEFQINSYTSSQQREASVTPVGSAGDFVVSWQSDGPDGSAYGISAQRFNSGGSRLGAEFQANSYTTGNQTSAAVARVGTAGDFVVLWQSTGQDGAGNGVFGQRFDSGGIRLGAEFQVNSYTTLAQITPAVAAVGTTGHFVASWLSNGQDGSNLGVFGQRFDSGGNKLGAEFQVNSYTTNYQRNPSVAALGTTGDFVVSWYSNGQDGSGYGVFAQRFDSGGTWQGAEFQVNSYTSGNQFIPSVAAVGTAGDFVVSWHSLGQDGSGDGAFGQRFDSGGTRQGAEFQINSYTMGSQSFPAVAAMGTTGDFVVSWHSIQDGSSYGVFGQRFDSTGTRQGVEFQVNSYTANQQIRAVVATVGTAGDFVVAWRSNGQDGSNYGVFGQRFSPPGASSVTLTAPTSTKENWAVGSVQRIRADHDLGDGATFNVLVSHDAGGTFPTTAGSDIVGSGAAINHLWTVTDNSGSPALPQSAKVQVVSVTPTSGQLDTSLTFLIQAPGLTVDRPRNNVRVINGAFTIVWMHNLGYRRPFKIELSRNGGTSYTETIAAEALSQWAWRGEATWVPTGANTCATLCKVKVTLLDGLGSVGESVGFKILP